MRNTAVVALIMCVVAICPIAASQSPNESDLAYLESLVSRDPANDAKASLAKGEKAFLGVAGYSVEIPGIDDRLAQCPWVHSRLRIIRGTSDAVYGERHIVLIGRAKEYAARYNSFTALSMKAELSHECAAP